MTTDSVGAYLDHVMRQLADAGVRQRVLEADRDALAAIVRLLVAGHVYRAILAAREWTKANPVTP